LYLFVDDLSKTIGFYQRLGLEIETVSNSFARASCGNGILLEFGTAELTKSYDPNWSPPGTLSKSTINFELNSREEVDETYRLMLSAGYDGHLEPCDPPWQARFAILTDPDRNFVGLHSPRSLDVDRAREQDNSN
ncbi:MAG: VOC family protein, partial [Cyanobacteria bacterium J06633_23]